jgi:iron complex outermembrane recepter protein
MKLQSLLLSVFAGTLAWSGLAAAQETSSQTASATPRVNPSSGLEEIVVTAERRTMNLQTTPIAVSVLSGEELANRGTSVVDQLQFVTPSAVVNNFGQGIDFNIRGIGKGEHNTQTATGVITYRDSVPSFPGYFTEEPYYDIKSIEVLRGPQGTFAGQNATGGAVFVNSNDPIINGGHSGYIQGQAGNYSDLALQGAFNMPISDTAAARLAFNGETRDSFYKIDGPWTGGDGGLTSGSLRFGWLWKPDDAWSVLFKADYNYIDMGAYPADPAYISPTYAAYGVTMNKNMFHISANADQLALDRFGRAILKVDYRFSDGMTLRSVTGYQHGNTAYRADLDGTDTFNSTFKDSADETLFSQELNLISPDTGPLKWVVGAFYQSNDYNFLPDAFVIYAPSPPFQVRPLSYYYVLDGKNNTWNAAGFAQITYDLPGGFQVELGGRYTKASTENIVHVDQYGTPIDDTQSADYTNWSGKAAVNWTINADQFLYAFVASGFKPGGLNVPVGLGLPEPFDSETVTSYELGWKSRWLDGHLSAQINGFYNNYDKFQVIVGYPAVPVFGFELNVPNPTTIYGFEAQINAAFGGFQVDGGLGILNSSLGKLYANDPRIPATLVWDPTNGYYYWPCEPKTGPAGPPPTAIKPLGGGQSCFNLKGNDQTYAPDLTANIGVQYEFAFLDTDTLTPRVSFAHVSEQWATLFENKSLGDRLSARNIWNAQIAWRHNEFIMTMYGTNITDENYVGALNSGLRFAGPPAQFGLRVMKSF